MFIVGHIFSCIFWGFAIALIVTSLTIYITKSLTVNRSLTIVSWCVGVALFVLLCIQSILAMGAYEAIDVVQQIEETVSTVAQKSDNENGTATTNNLQDAINEYKGEFPYIEKIIDTGTESATTTIEGVQNKIDESYKTLWHYIFRRTCWSILFLIVGIIAIVKTMQTTYRRRAERSPLQQNRRAPVSTRSARRRR